MLTGGGSARVRSHRRFVRTLVHIILDPLTYLVPLFLKRQCNRTRPPAPDLVEPGRERSVGVLHARAKAAQLGVADLGGGGSHCRGGRRGARGDGAMAGATGCWSDGAMERWLGTQGHHAGERQCGAAMRPGPLGRPPPPRCAGRPRRARARAWPSSSAASERVRRRGAAARASPPWALQGCEGAAVRQRSYAMVAEVRRVVPCYV
jgi:hypothetical protein